ncbi:MAG: hypothetical protein MI717_07270 [Spirochaetales bacterium]|nr:hypothetical protein [Spirochaetales bacterium]
MDKDKVFQATGRQIRDWFFWLTAQNGRNLDHKALVAILEKEGLGPWWSQQVVVLYERHIGRRVLGQTADGRFQIGVSRTISAPLEVLWAVFDSPDGFNLMMGNHFITQNWDLQNLVAKSADGCTIRITTYQHHSHLRMRYEHPDWEAHSLLQIRFTSKDVRCGITFHHEKLPHAKAREEMKNHWHEVATRVEESFLDGRNTT